MAPHNLACQITKTYYPGFVEQYEGRELDQKIDSLISVSDQQNDLESYISIAYNFSIMKWEEGNPVGALRYTGLVIERLEKEGIVAAIYTEALYNMGRFYFGNAQYEHAITYFEKVIALNNVPKKTGQAYCELGRCHNKTGDLFKSVAHFEKGLALLNDIQEFNSVTIQLLDLAETLRNIGDEESLQKRLKVLLRADSMSRHFNLNESNQRYLTNGLANQYISKYHYNFDLARYYYRLNLQASLSKKDSINIALALNNLSNLYNLENRDSARYFAQLGLTYSPDKDTRARRYDNLSQYYLQKDAFPMALKNIHQAMEVNLGLSADISEIPDRFDLNNCPFKPHALFLLKKKSELLIRLFNQDQDTTHLHLALKNIEAADILITIIQGEVFDPETKFYWREKASEIYLHGAMIAHLLARPLAALDFMEKNKAFLLAQEITKNSIITSLPYHISQRESKLKRSYLKLERELSRAKTTSEKRALSESLLDHKRLYEAYSDSLRLVYPVLFHQRSVPPSVAQSESRVHLKKNEVLISYIWNRIDEDTEVVIGFVADDQKKWTFEIKDTRSLQELLNSYKTSISQPFETQPDQTRFLDVSSQLFKVLFPTDDIASSLIGKNLYIIPDGSLQQIPFEALIVEREPSQYLFEKTNISYLYSRSFLEYNQGIKRTAPHTFLGYAPIEFSKTHLLPLENTAEEIEAINELMNGNIKVNDSATKESFLKESGAYKVIHLATHASAEGDPWIAFSDGTVELRELYTYKNNADLVTLSGCNTLVGELAKGEGIISLSRGFFYSGAKSVVSSLWNVNDRSTVSVMTDFYANLQSGQTKSEALNNAKRAYLNTHSLSEKSPYYWASLVLVGDAGTLDSKDPPYVYILLFLMIAALIMLVMKKKKKI